MTEPRMRMRQKGQQFDTRDRTSSPPVRRRLLAL